SGEGQSASAFMLIGKSETHVTGVQLVARLVGPRLIQRPLEPGYHTIASTHQLSGLDPASIRAQDLMIVGAHQPAPILQHYGDAPPPPLPHDSGLRSHRELAARSGTEQPYAPSRRHALDPAARPVGEQHGRSFGDARSTSIADEIEPQLVQILEHTR